MLFMGSPKYQSELLGMVEPDPIGIMLGQPGYWQFQSKGGIGGLAKWTDDRMDVLAVHAFGEGQGQFRRFVAAAKLEYRIICVWEVWNPILDAALERYGFERETEIQGSGEVIRGWRWDWSAENKPLTEVVG